MASRPDGRGGSRLMARAARQSALRASSGVQFVPGVGPTRGRALARAGYHTVADLLYHLPHRYEDRRRVIRVADLPSPGTYTFRGRLEEVRPIRTRRRGLSLVQGRLDDGSGRMRVVWFNRPYLATQVSPDTEYLLHGAVRARGSHLELVSPSCEPSQEALHAGSVVPVYPAVRGVGPMTLRRIFGRLLESFDTAAEIDERLPPGVLERHRLSPLPEALHRLHLPGDAADVEALNERRTPHHGRLIYGEFLELQLELSLLRSREIREEKAHRYAIDERARRVARAVLPFRLTEAQKRVLREIVEDLRSPHPMLRLLQGDVGCGKTIVAALCLVLAAESGLQAAFMAPTELLAEQHAASLERLLGERYRVALLTGSSADSRAAREGLRSGEVELAVGTHALIQEGVEFRRLGLAIIDEQHRFGVLQRQLLQHKGERPDVLVMTATPIPRSLALTAYGDLELSVIDELPPGRTPVRTEVSPASSRPRVYRRLLRDLDSGAQAYVVLPLIEESESLEAESLERRGEEIQTLLGRHRSALLHGRMSGPAREEIMHAFVVGDLRVLIATTVIEVGVDVPAASVMIIESAERFGLSQLHQLRGRVGRGRRTSRCELLHGRLGEEARRRLQLFSSTTDGFRIAEADLELRGPGDLLGTRQSGLPSFRVANLVADRHWLELAKRDARELIGRWRDPALEPLRRVVEPRVQSRYEQFAGG